MKGWPSSLISRQIVGGIQHRMSRAISLLAVWLSLVIGSTLYAASDPSDEQHYDIDIPSLNAAEALNRLAEQTGAIMLFPYDLAESRQANAVLGRFTLMDALGDLLKDSGLSSGLSDKRVIQIALDEPIERKKGEVEMATEKVSFGRKVGTFFASLLIATGASAQEAADADGAEGAEEVIEEVLVTGSRIRRDSFNVSTPLVIVGAEAITDTGLGSLAEILIDEIPSLYESSSNTNSQSSVSQTGLTTASLRRLGSNRTLTLIDGRRTVPNSYSGNYISFNTIPTGLVERVEIITGGSSATYGSDAVAGVVNIITQRDKVGFGFDTRYGETDEGGGEEYTVNVDYGTTFGDGRGYLFVAATYDRHEGIDHKDRKRAQLEANFSYDDDEMCNMMDTETGDQCMRDITPADWRQRSDGTAGGVFSERSGQGNWWYDENNVLQSGWSEERDGLFSRQWDVVKIPNEQTAVALKVDYELSEKTKAYFQVQFSYNTSFNFKSPEDEGENQSRIFFDPETGLPGRVSPGHISDDNPFALAAFAGDPNFPALWNGDWDRRFFEVGNITTDNERTTWRSWAGLQGSLFDDEWDWDISVGYGYYEQRQLRSNEIDVFKEAQALDAGFAADGVTIQCNDPVARADGCVPLNIFGIGSITPAMADWIRVNPTIKTELEQVNLLGYITGDLFDMPAGPVAAVFGAEFRRDSMDLSVSEGLQFGGVTFNLVPAISGDIDVAEVFAEASFPLAESITADVSVRVADYSPKGISTVFSYTTGLTWEPVEGYILRANLARAQRAPTITELLSPPRGDFDSYNDICAGVTATSTESGHDNCRLEPAIAAAIAADPLFEFDDDNNSYSPNAGNINLFEETADTYTVGFSIAPSFLEGFQLAVDYYDITIEDAIDSFTNEEILKQCFASSVTFGDPNPFCDDITRDSEGQITEILQRDFNLNETSTKGFDVALDYLFDMGRYGGLQLTTHYTHISEHETIFPGLDGAVTTSFNNQLDFGVFDDVATASLAWRSNDWRVRWRTTWKGPIIDHQDRVDDYLERFAENDALCAAADPGCITNPEVPGYLFYGSYIRHDLSASYDMTLDGGAKINLFAGVRNMFDKDPFVPRSGDNEEHGIANYDSKFGGGIGRFAYAGFAMRFDD